MSNCGRNRLAVRGAGWRKAITAARAAIAFAAVLLVVAGCSTVVAGHAMSNFNDPFHVAGLPANDGTSGIRPNAASPTGTVRNTDHGPIDRLALLSVDDVEEYWKGAYSQSLPGTYKPIDVLISYDSKDPSSKPICGLKTYEFVNAFYTDRCHLIAWDRKVLLPVAEQYFGEMGATGVLAHEFGHALQRMAKLVTDRDPVIVFEQQADCFAGVYMYWVAAGKSPRFTLSAGDGLDHVLAGLITGRDEVRAKKSRSEHGSALDRVSAFQMGFMSGAAACKGINKQEIEQRRGDLPQLLRTDTSGDTESGDVEVNEQELATLMEVLTVIFKPKQPPKLSFTQAGCPDAKPSEPASYCPATNTIAVDLPKLQAISKKSDSREYTLPQGDDTGFSIVMSRYALAVQHERGLPMQSPKTALRTSCLTGYVHRQMAEPIDTPDHDKLILSAGDVDKVISGLLLNRLVASDADGSTVPAGFTRIAAFRVGIAGNADACYSHYPA
jgi:predicted metalloprotease